jgi:ABC-type branched-subunit amino acid transport system ATPase component|tara:strand:- start:31934 stop:32323 length:390 start_codon:yes stop_codon:yes gene_type:complete
MANATLNVNFSISSSDLLNTVNLSKTVSDALTIDGDNRQGLTTMVTSTSYADINVEALSGSTQGGKKAYVYAKNTDATDDLIFADDGDQIFARLSPGEFLFYPSADNTKIQVKSSANTPRVEFLLLEVD